MKKFMKDRNIGYPLMLVSLLIFASLAAYLATDAERAGRVINTMFAVSTNNLGTIILCFGASAIIFCVYVMLKYGKIKLGNEKAAYSYPAYMAMLMAAALGSAAVNMSLVEWSWYYAYPGLGMEPLSQTAAEFSLTYSMFHWGILSWAIYGMAAIPVCYAYHVRRLDALRFSAVCEYMIGDKPYAKVIGKIVDFLFVISLVGGTVVTLGVGIPILSSGIGRIFGFAPTFATNIIVTLFIASLFSLSSYVGLEKGMKKISGAAMYIAIVFMAALLFVGPTQFILKNFTNSLGLMFQNYIQMTLWTDPISNGGFPEAWTIFYIIWGVAYATLVSLFVAKISRGRTLGEMIFGVVFGGSMGCWVFFGVNSGFALDLQLSGKFDVVKSMAEIGQSETIIRILSYTPFGIFGVIVFIVMAILFLATTMDSAAFTLSATTTKHLSQGENTSPMLRLFWCIVIALTPLAMTFIKAPFSSLQTLSIIAALPFTVVIILMALKSLKWLKEDE